MTPEQASERFHWTKYDKNTNTIELFLDNFMLSSARLCEAKFYMEHILNITPKYDTTERKPFFYDFGEYIHWCLEKFYESFKIEKKAPLIDDWLDKCRMKWAVMHMDDYANVPSEKDRKRYENIKGWEGVAGLLVGYYAYYMDMRLRVIDSEITFGHNKEVPIGKFWIVEPYTCKPQEGVLGLDLRSFKVECYLTGRIDLLVDNGYKIGPIDHKSTERFDGFEHNDFNPHDGITGYIVAINEILKNYAGMSLLKTPCMGGWIQHISTSRPTESENKRGKNKGKPTEPRFKTTPIDKTISQLEDYKKRQLSTFKRIAELLFNDKTPEWNTIACNNIFFRPCVYKPIHEQPPEQWQGVIDRFYQIGPVWDTREHSNKDNEEIIK
jgi:PD-(D/E)XK nuclease superfamily